MQDAVPLGFAHFLAQTDAVGRFVLAVLVLMSVASWTLIAGKALALWSLRRRAGRFRESFWRAPDLAVVRERLHGSSPEEPFSALVLEGFAALEQHARAAAQPSERRLMEAGGAEAFLTRALRRSIEASTSRLESGLTLLASVGSSAPFIGLFGTVWGIYHALLAIGLSGQGTLDRVAGPVGEALIMTALGLAVAIPAVLAYNAFVRANRVLLAELDGFAHELFNVLATSGQDPARDASPDTNDAALRSLSQVVAVQGGRA